jgi:hypothetical protein
VGLNTRAITISGVKAIVTRNIHILASIITASAKIGNNNIIPISVFIINFNKIPNVSESHHESVSINCPKFNVLEYIVIRGHTNHFDLSISVDRVVHHFIPFSRQLHHSHQKSPVLKNRLVSVIDGFFVLQPLDQLGSYFNCANMGIINQHSSNQLKVSVGSLAIISSSFFS